MQSDSYRNKPEFNNHRSRKGKRRTKGPKRRDPTRIDKTRRATGHRFLYSNMALEGIDGYKRTEEDENMEESEEE